VKKAYSKPLHKMIREAMESLGGERTIREVFDWIDSHYPEEKVNYISVSTAMSDLSINGLPSSQYPMNKRFLWRVRRGVYRLANEKDFAAIHKTPTKEPVKQVDKLFREHQVQKIVCKWLRDQGYIVIENCTDDPNIFDDITKCRTSKTFGIDIVAQKSSEKWIIQVKGETKGGTAAGEVDFYTGIGQLLRYMTKINEKTHYALAIPSTPHFTNVLQKFRYSKAILILKLHLILVNRDGSVKLIPPKEFYQH